MIALAAGTVELISLLIDAGYAVATITKAIQELSALPDAQLDEMLRDVEAARQTERDRRAQHGETDA